jgi:hydrogenase expression/formation protein HypE
MSAQVQTANPPRRWLAEDATIELAHGSGGQAMHRLIEDVFVGAFADLGLQGLEDQAVLGLEDLRAGERLAFTTDTYVVDPLFFPGGDIGTLAISGTVNDLAVGGARPLYLSCAMVLEEGLPVATLRRVVQSMCRTAREAGVRIVTGDTKVVGRGAVDKLFINTAGIGVIPEGISISQRHARVGDAILINGPIGEHGAAILVARNQLDLQGDVRSDCQPLNSLVTAMLSVCRDIHCLRDATRGGVATVLNEFASASGVAMRVREEAIPLRLEVKGACEILGLDPLYLANEGRLLAVVPAAAAPRVLSAMREHPAGRQSALIGEVIAKPAGMVILQTVFGGQRVVDMLVGDQLPRIC